MRCTDPRRSNDSTNAFQGLNDRIVRTLITDQAKRAKRTINTPLLTTSRLQRFGEFVTSLLARAFHRRLALGVTRLEIGSGVDE